MPKCMFPNCESRCAWDRSGIPILTNYCHYHLAELILIDDCHQTVLQTHLPSANAYLAALEADPQTPDSELCYAEWCYDLAASRAA